MTETATFAAGCFWGVEDVFRQLPGVISTQVGYTDGQTKNPTYEEVCTDATGHAEAVEVVFNPDEISYEDLLDIFFKIHNPTQLNRQGPDIGSQYRTAIFYHSPSQEAAARAFLEKLEQSGKFDCAIVTAIQPSSTFYRAEEYHQQYEAKHGRHCNLSSFL